jgi:hypothetical protein
MTRRLLAPIVLSAALLIACGGGNNEKTETATPAAGQTASATQPAAETSTPAPAAPDVFQGLKAYRYELKVTADPEELRIEGAFEAPDKDQVDVFLGASDQPVLSVLIIGDQAWEQDPSTGEWISVDIAGAQSDIKGFLANDFWSYLPLDDLTAASNDLGEEDVNGVSTHHYQTGNVDEALLGELTTMFGGSEGQPPQSFSADIWRAADGGWPAKASIDVVFGEGSLISQAHIDWVVSDVNSSDISIQSPG